MSMMSMMIGAGSGIVNPITGSALSHATGFGSSTATFSFFNNGATGASTTGSNPNWYNPTTSSIGSSYWIEFDGSGTWLALSSTRSVSLTAGNGNANHTVRIAADSSGTSIVSSGNIDLTTTNDA